MDNISVCGSNKREHLQNLRRLRGAVDNYELTFNEEKPIQAVEGLKLLGYKVKHKIEQMQKEYGHEEYFGNLHHFRTRGSIVAYFSYYSKYIRNYSDKILKYFQKNQTNKKRHPKS